MPLSGGEADKLGNSYEALWTVRYLLRIIDEKAQSIYLEPFGPEGDGIEFVIVGLNGTRELHQVKRQRAGGWSIRAMISASILSHFRSHLTTDPDAVCVFVSQDPPGDLRELCECAERATNYIQFERHYLRAEQRSGDFALLREHWNNCDPEAAFALLQRIRVQGIDERTLREDLSSHVAALVEGTPENVISALWVCVFDSIRKTLDATALWSYLESPDRGFRRRVWNNDTHLLQQISEANESYLGSVRLLDILGAPIPRPEAAYALDLLLSEGEKRRVLVSGAAGAGKTGVVAEIVERAQKLGWLVLAFRLDRLEANGTTVRQLGQQLGLPDSPVTVLTAAAGERPCLLVIDQLDAVSTTSGRNPAFFERVEDLLRQCRLHPHLRVVLACRKFDMDNDERLRRLIDERTGFARPLPVGSLDHEIVKEVISLVGVNASRLTDRQKTFLATPLHLKLFTEVGAPLSFESLKDLYDAYWEQKRQSVTTLLGREPHWNPVFDLILDKMVSRQALSAPEFVIKDEYPSDLAALLTEGILVREGQQLSFFHETFFDYAFARRFVARGNSLPSFLLGQEQHLFLRGIVRQVLTHERDADTTLYLSDLTELLEAKGLRFHLKRLIFDWLRGLSEPRVEEWRIVSSLAKSSDQDVVRWGGTVANSAAWFSLLDRTGWLQGELESDDAKRVQRAVNYVAWNAREAPESVAELLMEWTDKPEPWPEYAARIIPAADVDMSRLFVDVYIKLRSKGYLNLQGSPFGPASGLHSFYDLPEKQPEWAVEIFADWLITFIVDAERNDKANPFREGTGILSQHITGVDDRLRVMADKAPTAFVTRMLPIVLELVRRNAERALPKPWPDKVWRFYSNDDHYSLDGQLLDALVRGLRHLAANDSVAFQVHEEELQQYLDFETAGWILARAYAANGEAFAEKAARLLLASPEWLLLGWLGSWNWVSRELVAAITPHLTEETYAALELAALSLYPEWERRSRSGGWSQLCLLNGFSPERRSTALNRRLGELRRKFELDDVDGPRGVQGGFVGPPFSAQWDKMSDAQWLRAIRKYASEKGQSRDFLRGGASQLANVLQRQTEANPVRFAGLLLQLPPDTNPAYFNAILLGIKDAAQKKQGNSVTIDYSVVWNVIRHCHSLPDRPCGRFLSSLIPVYVAADIPQDILEIVAWYATEDPDPAEEKWQPANDRQAYYGGDASSAGLNSVRGGMAWAVAAILFEHPDCFAFFEPYLVQMVSDTSIAVRTQVAHALLPVLNIDRSRAVALFLRLCDPFDMAIFQSHYVVQFLSYAIWTHFRQMRPFLAKMLASDHPQLMNWGAQLSFMAAFFEPEAEPLVAACMSGAEKMREGVAELAADRVSHHEDRERCEATLLRSFNDESVDVRRVAGNCFLKMNEDALSQSTALIEGFIESTAFTEEAFAFFRALKDAAILLPDIICRAFEKSASLLEGVDRSEVVRTGRFADRDSVILVRLYQRTSDPHVKSRCLDIIDALARSDGAYHLQSTLVNREL